MTDVEQVLTVKISILNRPEEGIGTARYVFNERTTVWELADKVSTAVQEAAADAFGTIAEPVLQSAVDELFRPEE